MMSGIVPTLATQAAQQLEQEQMGTQAARAKANQGSRNDICQKSDKSIDTKKEVATSSSHRADDDLRWKCPARCQQRRSLAAQVAACCRWGGRGTAPRVPRIMGSTRTVNHWCRSTYSAASFCMRGRSAAAAGPPTPAHELPQMPADRAFKRHPQARHRQRCAAAGDHSQRARKGAQARRRRKNMPFFT